MAQSILQIVLRVTKEGSGERQAAKDAKALKGTLGELGLGSLASASALGILSGAVVAVGAYMVQGAEKAEKSNQVLAKQAQILIATNYAAGLTASQLNEMANAYSRLNGVDDDVIRDAQSMLLTFRQIGRETFPEALQATIDLSTTYGGMSQSAVQLGKALNDPIKGVTALAKSGVTFSEQQQEQIRNFQEMGQIGKAQAIILREIEMQVGGTAEAMEKASNGSVRMQVAYDDLQKEIAGNLLPAQRDWNLFLERTYESLLKQVTASNAATNAHQKQAEAMGLNQEQYRKARAMSESFREETDRLERQSNKATATTAFWNNQLMAQGQYFDKTSGKILSYANSLSVSEEALKELSAVNQAFYKGVETFQGLEDSYQDKLRANAEERKKIEQEKAEYIAKYGSWNIAELAKFDDALAANGQMAQQVAAEHEKATRKVILGYIEQKMMADGILDDKETEWLLKKGVEWGIYSETAISEMKKAMDEAQAYIDVLNGIPSQVVTQVWFQAPSGGGNGAAVAYASGTDGWETVPGGYPNDSYPIFLTSGEKFAVIPAGQGSESYAGVGVSGGQGGEQVVTIRLAGDAERLFQPLIERAVKRMR